MGNARRIERVLGWVRRLITFEVKEPPPEAFDDWVTRMLGLAREAGAE